MSQTQLTGEMQAGTEKHNTPLKYVAPIAEAVDGFDLDPCASTDSNLAETNIRNEGGLAASWDEYRTVWCNHPYSDPTPWIRKAAECEAQTVVTLSKADPSADWFQYELLRARSLWFPPSRYEFIGYENSAGFPVVFGVFGEEPDELTRYFNREGWYQPLTGSTQDTEGSDE